MSFASSERKNIQRKINDHKKFGKKGDGVIRLYKDRLESGAIEAGRKWEETNGTKYMSDSLKISKMLKDMLDKLIRECKIKESLIKKLKVIGILHGANRLQVLTVDHPKGYITRINRNNVQEVAGRLTNAKPLAFVLKEVNNVPPTHCAWLCKFAYFRLCDPQKISNSLCNPDHFCREKIEVIYPYRDVRYVSQSRNNRQKTQGHARYESVFVDTRGSEIHLHLLDNCTGILTERKL
nr:9718_t:CDS:2 [Entrophospora candida]